MTSRAFMNAARTKYIEETKKKIEAMEKAIEEKSTPV